MNTIAIFDYGSQYTQLIARRIREKEVYSEIVPWTTKAADLAADPPAGIILSGGPDSVFAPGAPSIDPAVFSLGVPVLGICYGMQLTAKTLGGSVVKGESGEYGKAEMRVVSEEGLFAGLPGSFMVWMSHGDRVETPPPGFATLAESGNCPCAAMADAARRFYAIQFHPEVVHTSFGGEILSNFVFRSLRMQARLEDFRLDRPHRRAVARTDRRRRSRARAFRRRRFLGGRRPPRPRHRQAPALHIRR